MEQLGDAVGITKGAIGHIETARNGSSTDTLMEIARTLRARWEIRLIGLGEEPVRDESRQKILDITDQIVDQLSDRDVRQLLGILKNYLEELDRDRDDPEDGVHGQSSK